jgi:hypothetical protein
MPLGNQGTSFFDDRLSIKDKRRAFVLKIWVSLIDSAQRLGSRLGVIDYVRFAVKLQRYLLANSLIV